MATLQLAFDPPAIGTLVASWVLTGGFPGIRIRVHGSKGLGEVRDGDLPDLRAELCAPVVAR